MSTVYRDGEAVHLFAKGALEALLPRCTSYCAVDASRKTMCDEVKRQVSERAAVFEDQAYRVLAMVQGEGDGEESLTFLGLMMITGDNPRTAAAIAAKIGLVFDRVLTGLDLERMSDEELAKVLEDQDVLFARMASSQKLKVATALQNNGEVVAMTGDGVNDVPALKKADIGIAMGLSGTEVAKEAADMVLLDDNFSSIVTAIEEGRTVYFNTKKFVTYFLASNIPEIVPCVLQFFFKDSTAADRDSDPVY